MNARDAVIDAAFAGSLGQFSLDVSFTFPAYGTTALFGASGSGKTTLLRCIAGLQRLPGRLAVNGETWQDDARGVWRKPHTRPIGYVFQEASLFTHLSVRDNLHFGRRERGAADGLDSGDVIELLGLGGLLHRAPAALSGGERQRVALGRALLSRPRLLLMDEPLSALDRGAREQILPYIEALNDSFSIPVLYVSHDIAEVSRLADRIVVLSAGSKLAEGPLQEILERVDLGPATGRFEAHVVLDAQVVAHDDTYCLTSLDHHGQRLTTPLMDRAIGEHVRLRVRARDVSLAIQRPEGLSVRNVLAGTIVQIMEERDTAYAETLVDIGGARLRARLTRKSVAELGLAPGAAVFALIKSITFDRGGASARRTLTEHLGNR